jgi:serine phosphatase RsbU (regulator of sigma subunit)
VATVFRPVIQVGGDIYGWLRMVDRRILFWIADATGHGAAAALLTTLAKLLFQHGGTEHATAAEIMEAVNNDFRSIFGARSFMTAMCVALDPESGRATVVGAGHPPLIVMRRQAAPETIASAAPPLGLLEDSHFQETTIELQRGDAFFLHTDGLYASSRKDSRRWTSERVQQLFAPNERNAAEFLEHLLREIAPEEGEPLADDLAALIVRRLPG